MRRTLATILAVSGLLVGAGRVSAQPTQQLKSLNKTGDITANGGSVELLNTGGLAGLRVQSTGTYTGTWEVQCSAAPTGTTPVYDTDDEVNLSLEGASSAAVQSVTDSVAEWTANISGCTAIKVIATSSMTGTLTIYLSATTTAGGAGGGGGAGSTDGVAQGSTTSGQSGVLAQGAVTTAAPTYTTGQTDPLSLDVNGALRVAITSGAGSGGTALADRSGTFTPNSTSFTPTGGYMDDTSPDACTEGAPCTFRVSSARALHMNLAQVAGATVQTGSGTATGAQRVELANNGTGVLGTVGTVTTVSTVTNVATIGTSVTPGTAATNLGKAEDAAHTTADVGVMAMGVRTDTAASLSGTTGDYNPFITDVLGKLWTTGSYAEDAAHADGETGNLVLAVRRDANTSLVDTTGDRAPLQVDATGSLKVAIISGAGSGGTAMADNAAFTPATTNFTPIGGEVDDTGTTAATENSAGAARMTVQRALHVNLRSAAGVELTPSTDQTLDAALTTTGPLMVGRGSTATPTAMSADNDATALWVDLNGRLHTATEGVEDVAETAAAPLNMAGSVRRDTAASSAGTTGDNATINTDSIGRLWTTATEIEDVAETAAGQLSMAGAVRRDVLASSSGTSGDNSTINTTSNGALWVAQPDPCSFGTKVFVNINQTTGTQLFTGTASNRTYVCSFHLVTATAQNIALVSGTGTVCATGIAGMAGGTTAATGWNLPANGVMGAVGGNASVAKSAANADNVCILQSGSGQISGNIVYVVAP